MNYENEIVILPISRHQLKAGNSVIDYYLGQLRWVILFAQPQSGKGDTFYFTAAEALRQGIIQNVIIFSGNTEKELANQLRSNLEKFVDKYDLYMEEVLHITSMARAQMRQRIRLSISIKWGVELQRIPQDTSNTLFIWEESHSAQNIEMRPGKFLAKVGISATGDVSMLDAKNNFFLSVSATPFSEVSDLIHDEPDQFKAMVHLEVDDGYRGLEKMMLDRCVRPFYEWKDGFRTALLLHSGPVPKYVIIRVRNEAMSDIAKAIADSEGYLVKVYNGDTKEIDNLDALSIAPTTNTVIIIKGMCRMGKVVPKQHISFCFESSTTSNTDVVLQGLLGRMFGWHDYSGIVVYVHNRILSWKSVCFIGEERLVLTEFERYIHFTRGDRILPKKGSNIKKGLSHSRGGLNPIIPIRISASDRIVDGSEDDTGMDSKDAIVESIRAAFADGRITQNLNDDEQYQEVRDMVLSFDDTQFEVRDASHTTYESVSRKIHEQVLCGIPKALGSSCGISADGNELKLYFFRHSIKEHGIRAGDIFLDARTQSENSQLMETSRRDANVPKTTRMEVFCKREETGIEVVNNGSYTIPIPVDTCIDVDAMMRTLLTLIELSRTPSYPNRMTSNQTTDSRWQGIHVNDSVLHALKRGGEIYRKVNQQLGLKIKVKKASGPTPRQVTMNGFTRLSEIAWI